MRYKLRVFLKALRFLGRRDPADRHRIGLREALYVADVALDEGPSLEDVARWQAEWEAEDRSAGNRTRGREVS